MDLRIFTIDWKLITKWINFISKIGITLKENVVENLINVMKMCDKIVRARK